jgi:hypothetical protein
MDISTVTTGILPMTLPPTAIGPARASWFPAGLLAQGETDGFPPPPTSSLTAGSGACGSRYPALIDTERSKARLRPSVRFDGDGRDCSP